MIRIEIPGMRLCSLTNAREHHMVKAKRARAQRQAAQWAIRSRWTEFIYHRAYEIEITRLGPRVLDSDNLASSAKSVRDGIADALGVDDGDPRITWLYAQEKGRPREYGVRIEIRERRREQEQPEQVHGARVKCKVTGA